MPLRWSLWWDLLGRFLQILRSYGASSSGESPFGDLTEICLIWPLRLAP